jgi:very-short-patch-repair endonuclease
MRIAAQTVSGERVVGSAAKDAFTPRYASSRVTMGVGANVLKSYRTAQTMPNSITTAPNFYSPFLTARAYQVPNARREVYLWANWWRNNEPKIAAAINFYKMFPFSGWKLECSSSYVKDYFEKLIQKLNFQKWLPEISGVYHLFGDCFVLASLDCEHCRGSNIDSRTGEACNHDGATWSSLAILNPDSVHIMPGIPGQQGVYRYQPSEREIRLVSERQSNEFYDELPDNVRRLIRKGEPFKLNPICIEHFKFGSTPWEDYGTPMIRPLFPTLAYKDKLRNAQWLVAERHILPVKVVKVGSDNRPANQADLDSVQEELAAVANDPNLTLVTHHAFDFDYVGASGKVLQLTNEFELIDQEILDGVMLNKALLNGEGPTYGNAQVGLLAMAQRLETFRREVARWIEEKIFKPVAEWNGFVIEGERGQEEIVYPKIKFDDLQLRDETGKLQMIVTANSNGVISNYTTIEAFGLNPDQEIERLREEQGANFIANPAIGNTDLGNGFAGDMGAGFGGGMPPMGGMPTPPMGGTPGVPGMPPMGADMGGMPPVGALNYKSNYRLAAKVVNDIYAEREGLYKQDMQQRTASRTIKSQAHREFVQSLRPVSGRGVVGALPEEYDGFGNPLEPQAFGGAFCFPVNHSAIREWGKVIAEASEDSLGRQALAAREEIQRRVALGKKGKKDDTPQPMLFTSIEKKLYYLLTSLNLPFAIYAQYSMGQTSDYTLDAAIPALRIGIEADGEIWHNSPDKIARDKRRDMELAANGWTILRFTDKELHDRPNEVAQVIMQAIRQVARPGEDAQGNVVL